MGELLSCPFCRELFADDEGPKCPECDLPLVPIHQLPLSREAQAEAGDELDPPEDQTLPLAYLGRGRGALMLVTVLGFVLFFQPWVTLLRPDPIALSGRDLAGGNAPWLWGGAVGWFILLPLIVSRRTVTELRGVRAIAVMFAALTLGEGLMLLLRPPIEHGYFSAGLEYAWGLYANLGVSSLGIYLSLRLGGSLEDLRDLPVEAPHAQGPQAGESLH